MLHIGEGRFEKAKECVFANHTLTRSCNQQVWSIDRLVGNAIDARNFKAEVALLLHGEFTVKEFLAYRNELESLPKVRPLEQILDESERCATIQAIIYMGKGVEPIDDWVSDFPLEQPDEGESFAVKVYSNFLIDWNLVLRETNMAFDRLVEIAQYPREKRIAELGRFDREIQIVADAALPVATSFWSGIHQRSEAFADVILYSMLLNTGNLLESDDRRETRFRLILLTALLQAYRQDHGEYPASLQQLVPKYADAIPIDIYSEEPLIYKSREDAFLLYSVGENSFDDGGKSYDNSEDSDDIVVKSPAWKD